MFRKIHDSVTNTINDNHELIPRQLKFLYTCKKESQSLLQMFDMCRMWDDVNQ